MCARLAMQYDKYVSGSLCSSAIRVIGILIAALPSTISEFAQVVFETVDLARSLIAFCSEDDVDVVTSSIITLSKCATSFDTHRSIAFQVHKMSDLCASQVPYNTSHTCYFSLAYVYVYASVYV